ncbi:MAG TPA: NAD(+)--rifampin ADP-ribosyltransferase [Thermoanaerobaculia bacterium]|nr:NAD(+)--rifampin ADP-ribosyltransferase [Thermoanaerobaculia bacterium]
MDFNPNNPVVQLCIQGMEREGKGEPEEAQRLFLQAWSDAANDFERFIAAYFVARQHPDAAGRLEWLQTALQLALQVNDESVAAAFPFLYANIAECQEASGDHASAEANRERAISFDHAPSDRGPFYHGTKADLRIGDLLTPGFESNYAADVVMNHIYFTALIHGAGLAAALAKGNGRERVYVVEPAGSFEHDPNVTNKRFPGNPTRSYRTQAPLEIVGEVTDWVPQTPEELARWRERLAAGKGKIIN